jgi:hypothetical protein
MLGNSLPQREQIRTRFGLTQFRDSFVALKRTMGKVGRVIVPSAERRMACPKCHWQCAQLSKRRTGLDSVLGLFLLRPFRCRSCRRRYYRLSL